MKDEPDYAAEMRLPPGKTCGCCRHFKRTCSWLISCAPTNTSCDWHPSRFRDSAEVAAGKAIWNAAIEAAAEIVTRSRAWDGASHDRLVALAGQIRALAEPVS